MDVSSVVDSVSSAVVAIGLIGGAILVMWVTVYSYRWVKSTLGNGYADENLSDEIMFQIDAEVEAEIEALEMEEGESESDFEDRKESLRDWIDQLSDDELLERYGI